MMTTTATLRSAVSNIRSPLISEPLEIGLFLHCVGHVRGDERVASYLTRKFIIEVAHIGLSGGARWTELGRVLFIVHLSKVKIAEEASLFQLLGSCRA